jgi:hypothetical protein
VKSLNQDFGLESGTLGLGLGLAEATFLVLASCRVPVAALPASFGMTGEVMRSAVEIGWT